MSRDITMVGREGFEPPTPCASCKPPTVHLVHGRRSRVVASTACRCVQAAHKCSTVQGVPSRDVACRAVLPCLRQPPGRALATFVATSTAYPSLRPVMLRCRRPRSRQDRRWLADLLQAFGLIRSQESTCPPPAIGGSASSEVAPEKHHWTAVVRVWGDGLEPEPFVESDGRGAFSDHVQDNSPVSERACALECSPQELAAHTTSLFAVKDVHPFQPRRHLVMSDEEGNQFAVGYCQNHVAFGRGSKAGEVREECSMGCGERLRDAS
jgi:hypothetical protein